MQTLSNTRRLTRRDDSKRKTTGTITGKEVLFPFKLFRNALLATTNIATMTDTTTIEVTEEQADELHKLKQRGESYKDVLDRLLTTWHQFR